MQIKRKLMKIKSLKIWLNEYIILNQLLIIHKLLINFYIYLNIILSNINFG